MRVLLVEDDDMIGEAVRKGLRQDGFAIDWVSDGEAAVQAVGAPGAAAAAAESSASMFDLMLLDLGLPKRDGLDVVHEVRRRGIALPILILTARDAVADRVAGLNAGADDYLVKPFDLQELAARMHALLRRQGGRADPLMRHGDVLLNPVTREVLRAGVPVKLSGREFAVLHALLSRPGKVWSIAQLQDNLYGWDEEVGSNTVEVYIHALRKKLGSHFIQNIRGVGYVIPREVPTPPAEPTDRPDAQ
ncbi:response regulator transcription factor [Ralstonia solanacearum]|nr:response regulator transcription factor [Ralstonia solanacearum]AYB63395.1 DNA-binding response regulator [Ralstonia solanacearum]MCG3576660.1 response regulator transcription factor [Ralstonia solanacearum]MDC6298101.1 response regulator transcription factor [Ralstonia solanacearum]MDC6313180.1 response regulator transcription factor [Ralstonia solanacearum]QJC22920.1 response regulator transcription factor [Ralstonia solanacearum]